MDASEIVRAALVEAAKTLDPLSLIEDDVESDGDMARTEGAASWAFAFEGDDVIVVDHAPAERRVYFTAVIGAPPKERRLAVYELLLQYNAHWSETGGVRLAGEGAGGPILQIYDMQADGLTAGDVAAAVSGLLAKLPEWRALIERKDDAEAPDAMPGAGLRV